MKFREKVSSPEATRLGKRLFSAIDKGNMALAHELLDKGADVNYQDPKKGSSPLIRAVARKRGVGFLKQLVQRGAGIHYKGPLVGTPLLNAVLANDVEAFKYLVSCGADPMQELPAGYLLNDACAMGFVEMVKELLRIGVEIDAQNAAGQTALAQAVAFENLDLVRLLLKAGASPHAGGPEATAIHWATEFGSPEVKKLLGIKPKL